jgi:hypothetical protein
MSSRKPCIRCGRQIDQWSKICPFCNWDQENAALPAAEESAQQAAAYIPPAGKTWRNRIAIAVTGVLLLIASFGIGYLINKDDAVEKAPEPVTEASDDREKTAVRRNEVNLVPVNEPMGEAPITSAPAGDLAEGSSNQYDRSDATAVASDEYAQLAARAQAERQRMKAIVDPRSLTGTAYAQAPRAAAPRRPSPTGAIPSGGGTMSIRTRAVPLEQPLPSLNVSQRSVAKLDLLVGADGSVREVDVRQAVAGETPRLVQAVQRWRFKPATENGRPIASNFSVEVTFNP